MFFNHLFFLVISNMTVVQSRNNQRPRDVYWEIIYIAEVVELNKWSRQSLYISYVLYVYESISPELNTHKKSFRKHIDITLAYN